MVRTRFDVKTVDYLPPRHPIHPYWCAGKDNYSVSIVAYAENEAEILRLWPKAQNIEVTVVDKYVFTDRFPRPAWLPLNGEKA